jgi:putative IMPACT (imprinted ancient) family translation regulator
LVGIESPYPLYEQVKRLIAQYNGDIQDEIFTADVTIMATFPLMDLDSFTSELSDLSAGRIQPVIFDND